jgi:hypothetical protein
MAWRSGVPKFKENSGVVRICRSPELENWVEFWRVSSPS